MEDRRNKQLECNCPACSIYIQRRLCILLMRQGYMARRRRCRTASALCAHGLGALQAGVQFGLRRLLRGPALHMLLGDAAQRRDPGRAVVEAGNELELLATGMQEGLARFLADFLQRFQAVAGEAGRSEEHTSELQSQSNLVCRLLLEKKKKT